MKIHRRQAKQAPPLSEVYKTEESQSQMDLKERLKLDQLIVCLFFPVFFSWFPFEILCCSPFYSALTLDYMRHHFVLAPVPSIYVIRCRILWNWGRGVRRKGGESCIFHFSTRCVLAAYYHSLLVTFLIFCRLDLNPGVTFVHGKRTQVGHECWPLGTTWANRSGGKVK